MWKVCIVGGTGSLGNAIVNELMQDSTFKVTLIISGKKRTESIHHIRNDIKLDTHISPYKGSFDILIDCSTHRALDANVDHYRNLGIPLLIATTNISNFALSNLKEYSKTAPVCISPNFCVKAQVFLKILEYAIPKLQGNAECHIVETHQKSKIDKPSGTAKYILNLFSKKYRDKVDVLSIREGNLSGKHEVTFTDNDNNIIQISHQSGNRSGYAKGIRKCMMKIMKLRNGMYDFSDLFDL